MSILRSEIAQRVFNTPLLIEAGKGEAALAAVGGRIVAGGVVFSNGVGAVEHAAFENGRPSLGRIGDGLGRAFDNAGVLPFDVVDNVAVIPIEGTLVHKGAYVGMASGRTSYQGLQTQALRAARSDKVKGVVLEVDSFGGEAAGAFDAADTIAAVSKVKPTLAILTDNALSAGYLLASAARSIVAPPDGMAGSIGAIAFHMDISKALEQEGVKVTVLRAGAKKARLNQFEPLPADIADEALSRLEALRQRFADTVGRNRRGRISAGKAMATEAASFGAPEAQALGLIDAVGKAADAFDLFVKEVNRKT